MNTSQQATGIWINGIMKRFSVWKPRRFSQFDVLHDRWGEIIQYTIFPLKEYRVSVQSP